MNGVQLRYFTYSFPYILTITFSSCKATPTIIRVEISHRRLGDRT